MTTTTRENLREVTRSVPRLEGIAKVTGTVEYTHHVVLPGMLYGKIVRSTAAHARLRAIDAADALALEGVHSVITGADVQRLVPNPYYGPAFHDQPVLAIGKVHHVGEPVAIVLAADPQVAEAGASRVTVTYDELPAVFDEVAATQPGAPVVHDELRPAATFPDLKHLQGRRGTNVALDAHVRHGADVEAAFARCDRVFDDTFRSGAVMHTPLEPMVTVAETATGEDLTIYSATQSPSFVRMEISRLLGWPENRVRVRAAFLGGGFGAKLYIKLEALAAVCALIARKPVKIALSMDEQFYTITKHGTTIRMRTGVMRDGTIVARKVETWWNGGAFADIGPRVTQKSGFTAAGPYDIPNVALDSYAVYTNLPPAGAFRGFGIPQLVWAYESQADIIARELGIDPVAFRLANCLRDGRPHATGTVMRNAKIAECVEAVARRLQAGSGPLPAGGPLRRGRGVAVGIKACISPTTSVAVVTVAADGSCVLSISTVDMGQGSDTAMAQVAAEVLGLRTEAIRVVHSDTDVTPYDMATLGSRSTYHMGHAVRLAAEDARDQLLDLAASNLGVPADRLICAGGEIRTPDGAGCSLRELFVARFGMQAGNVVGSGSFEPPYAKPDADGQSPNVTPFWMIGATGAEITVDVETGRIVVDRLVCAGDVGRAINPAIVERQLSGAAVMALGSSIGEVMVFEDGRLLNGSLADYKIPSFLDVPAAIEAVLIEEAHPAAPFGAKGVGESGAFAVTPAIANALCDATGVRVREMPLTPERVLRALREAANAPLGAD